MTNCSKNSLQLSPDDLCVSLGPLERQGDQCWHWDQLVPSSISRVEVDEMEVIPGGFSFLCILIPVFLSEWAFSLACP